MDQLYQEEKHQFNLHVAIKFIQMNYIFAGFICVNS